jgi:hypothetical protein
MTIFPNKDLAAPTVPPGLAASAANPDTSTTSFFEELLLDEEPLLLVFLFRTRNTTRAPINRNNMRPLPEMRRRPVVIYLL